MRQQPITLHTIGDLRARGHGLAASCSNPDCSRSPRGAWLDLDALVAERGAGLAVTRLRELVRCGVCRRPGGISIVSDRPSRGRTLST